MVWAVCDLCALDQVLGFALDTEKEREKRLDTGQARQHYRIVFQSFAPR